jgi:hypothetical protein
MELKTNLTKSLLIFTLLFVYLVIETTLLAIGVVHPSVIEYVIIADSIIFLLQIIFLSILHFIVKKNKFFLIFISAITIINILVLKLSYYQFFLQYESVLQLIIGLILFGLFYRLYSSIQISKNVFFSISLILIVLIALPIFQFISKSSDNVADNSWTGEHREVAKNLLDNNFVNKPNIHIIGFDALTPEKLVRKFFNESDPLPYVDTVNKYNGVIFNNSFVMRVATERSWASFLMLDQEPFDHQHNRFNGEKDTLLFNLFRSNGYSILTGYSGSYFGVNKGDYVDVYDNFSEEAGVNDSVYCLNLSTNEVVAFFFPRNYDICNASLFKSIRDIYFAKVAKPKFGAGQEFHLTEELQMQFQDKAVENIASVEASGEPWITMHHFPTIGHVGSGFKTYNQEHIDEYYEGSYKPKMDKVSSAIEKILDAASENSIVIIMGDHGPFISTSIVNLTYATNPVEEEFYVQDRHGVFTAIFNEPKECVNSSETFMPYYTFHVDGKKQSRIAGQDDIVGAFTSPARVLSGVVRCLVDKPESLDKYVRFGNPLSFEKYLYD